MRYRYLAAYSIPALAGLGLYLGGPFAWLTVPAVYVGVPLADMLGGRDDRNFSPATPSPNGPLFFGVLVQFILLFGFALTWSQEADGLTRLGWIVSVALACGGIGIVVAHELVHRRSLFERLCGKLVLMSVLYMHFAIEHVRGHHVHVGTDADPASARLGQSIYAFLPSSVVRQMVSAWALEHERLVKEKRALWSIHNEMLWIAAIQSTWLACIGFFFGFSFLMAYAAMAVMAFSLLEVVNYVEHYGLRRIRDAAGRIEPVRARHSWNSDHRVSRALLFELPRHTDHHMNGMRAYSSLQSVTGAPQLPAGYPAMVVLALIPPLWFRVMNPRVAALT